MKTMKAYYEINNSILYKGNCFKVLKLIPEKSVDFIFSDPPYFLSSGGISCKNGQQVIVNKGDWDLSKNIGRLLWRYLFNDLMLLSSKHFIVSLPLNGTLKYPFELTRYKPLKHALFK